MKRTKLKVIKKNRVAMSIAYNWLLTSLSDMHIKFVPQTLPRDFDGATQRGVLLD